jgi:hypothetical protein
MKPITVTLISFIRPPPSHKYLPTHTAPILQSCLSFLIFKLMFKGVSQCIPAMRILYFGPFNPFHYSPLPLYLPPAPIIQQPSVYILISSTFTDVMFYNISNALAFSFPFPPSLSSVKKFHCYKHVLPLSLYMVMFVFVYIFWLHLPHMREYIWPLSF